MGKLQKDSVEADSRPCGWAYRVEHSQNIEQCTLQEKSLGSFYFCCFLCLPVGFTLNPPR